MDIRRKKRAVVLTTGGRGGILSVVESLKQDGLGRDLAPVVIHTTSEGSVPSRLLLGVRALLAFLKLLAFDQVAIVHCHVSYRGSFWRKTIFVLLAGLRRLPVIFHMHGSEFKAFYGAQLAPLQWVIRAVLQRVDRVIVLSDSWKDYIQGIAPRSRVIVVPNYVDSAKGGSERKNGGSSTALLFLGVLGNRKGIYDLLDAFTEVARQHPDVTLYIGGNGEVEQVDQAIMRHGLEGRAQLLGWVAGSKKEKLLAQAEVFVLPSYNEGLPVSILEAMSRGVAVLSTTVGGIPQLVRDGKDGFLIEPGDVAALTERLNLLCGDAVLRKKMGSAARERVMAEFSKDAVLPMLHALYTELAVTK